MPRIALVCACLAGACSFEADYTEGPFYCRDSPACPDGLTCAEDKVCRPLADAAIHTPDDAMIDARVAALNCADPGVLGQASGAVTGSTSSRLDTVQAMCDGSVMFGRDAVYRVDVDAGAMILVDIAGTQRAYVITACSTPPASPMCVGGSSARAGNPINITASAAGPHFIVVDHPTVNVGGDYELTVTVQ